MKKIKKGFAMLEGKWARQSKPDFVVTKVTERPDSDWVDYEGVQLRNNNLPFKGTCERMYFFVHYKPIEDQPPVMPAPQIEKASPSEPADESE